MIWLLQDEACKQTNRNKNKRTKNERRKKERKLTVCRWVQVVVLVGITWMLGLLAAFVDNAVLWLLFTLVNASLGFFIAIVLVCNRRVMSTLLRSCRPRPPDPCTAVQSAQTTTPKF